MRLQDVYDQNRRFKRGGEAYVDLDAQEEGRNAFLHQHRRSFYLVSTRGLAFDPERNCFRQIIHSDLPRKEQVGLVINLSADQRSGHHLFASNFVNGSLTTSSIDDIK